MKIPCPHCGADLGCHDDITGTASPSPGDVSVCAECGCVSVYAEGTGLFLRKPTGDELSKFGADPRLATALAALSSHNSVHDAVRAVRRSLTDDGGVAP